MTRVLPVAMRIEERRAFCARVCAAFPLMTAVLLEACRSGSPTAPSQTSIASAIVAPPGSPPSPSELPLPPQLPPSTSVISAVPLIAAALVNDTVTIAIASASPLSMVGGVARAQVVVRNIYRDILIARLTHQDFSALNAICTHEGCIVAGVAFPHFVCPCHGSRYNLNGGVIQGPAPAALVRLPALFADPTLSIDVSFF